jgi:hypothetical protein
VGVHSHLLVFVSVIMTEETLRELIAGGGTATVEFKSSATRPIEVAVRVCGIANNRAGGIIIFGIEDATWAIVGIRNPSLTNDVVLRAARMIKPAVPLGETVERTQYRHASARDAPKAPAVRVGARTGLARPAGEAQYRTRGGRQEGASGSSPVVTKLLQAKFT